MRGFAFARYYGSRLLLNTALTLNRVCSTLNRGNGDHEASRRSHRFLFSRLDRSSLASIHLSVFRSNLCSRRRISSARTNRIRTIYNWNIFRVAYYTVYDHHRVVSASKHSIYSRKPCEAIQWTNMYPKATARKILIA